MPLQTYNQYFGPPAQSDVGNLFRGMLTGSQLQENQQQNLFRQELMRRQEEDRARTQGRENVLQGREDVLWERQNKEYQTEQTKKILERTLKYIPQTLEEYKAKGQGLITNITKEFRNAFGEDLPEDYAAILLGLTSDLQSGDDTKIKEGFDYLQGIRQQMELQTPEEERKALYETEYQKYKAAEQAKKDVGAPSEKGPIPGSPAWHEMKRKQEEDKLKLQQQYSDKEKEPSVMTVSEAQKEVARITGRDIDFMALSAMNPEDRKLYLLRASQGVQVDPNSEDGQRLKRAYQVIDQAASRALGQQGTPTQEGVTIDQQVWQALKGLQTGETLHVQSPDGEHMWLKLDAEGNAVRVK